MSSILDTARRILDGEAEAIRRTAAHLDGTFEEVVRLVAAGTGKVIVTGIGKSGLVAEKIAATMISTGLDAVSIHPVDALHGDIAAVRDGDVILALSATGTTEELLLFLRTVRALRNPATRIVAITGNPASPLAQLADLVLFADAPPEADILGVLPTSSTTAAIAIGDAIAMAAMVEREVTLDDLARNHPGGAIGTSLNTRVAELLHPIAACAVVTLDDPMSEVVLRMTAQPLGAALILAADGTLAGIVTEGDLRRALQRDAATFLHTACRTYMTATPRTVAASALAIEALRLMEQVPNVYVLPVLDDDGRCAGLLRMHDLIQRGLGVTARGER